MIRLLVVATFLISAQPALAEMLPLTALLPGHANATGLNLARSIVTDLVPTADGSASGETVIPVRHLVPGQGGRNPASVNLRQYDLYSFRADAHDWLLAVFDLGSTDDRVEPTVIAAVFDDRLRLVDAADVALAPQVDVESLPFRISPWNDAIVFASRYPTAYATSTEHELVFYRNGRLQLVDRFATTDSTDCGLQELQSVSFEVPDMSGKSFWPIEVTRRESLDIDLTATCEETIGLSSHDRMSTTLYVWDDASQAYHPAPSSAS